jgi:hypothetical protein
VFAFAAFCAVPLPPQLPATTFGIVVPINLRRFAPPMLRPMAVKGVPPGDAGIVLAFAAAVAAMAAIGIPPGDKGIALAFAASAVAASMFVGRGDGVCDIVASLGESWV